MPRVVFNQQCQGDTLTTVKELPWRFGNHFKGAIWVEKVTGGPKKAEIYMLFAVFAFCDIKVTKIKKDQT